MVLPITKYLKGEIVNIVEFKNEENRIFENQKFFNYNIKFIDANGFSSSTTIYSNGQNYKVGDKVYVQEVTGPDYKYLALGDKMREPEIFGMLALFFIIIISIFGKKGLKALFSLVVSLFIIIFILLPLTLKGYNPVLVAGLISTLLLVCIMFITHGRNRVTYAALLGCVFSISVTIFLSYFIILYSRISGFVDEESAYLQFGLGSNLNLSLLVIASIIIGVIGAVDDGAITQAGIVREIKSHKKGLQPYYYYKRAMEIGKDHGSAMINTLVLAYVASSLPLIILFYTSHISPLMLINREMVAVEIFRSLIGSIGLLLAIPMTTIFAIFLIRDEDLKTDDEHMSHAGHSHHHH